jgi:amino acid transporter
VAYIAYEAAVAAIFAAFASTTSHDQFGVDIHWTVFALIYLILATFLGHRKIDFASKVLIILLFSEISILALMTIGVFINGGGPDGFVFSLLNPMEAFGGPSPGLGIFFAFSCWVGFESTALYGEESRNPKKIIPRATYICVISIGLFYVLVAWAAIIGNGLTQSIELSQTDPFALFFNPTSQYIGAWGVTIFQWLIITGSFACAIAFHNSAARYLYAIGREGFIHKSLGRTHRKHGSPYVASIVETIIVAIVLFLFWVNDFDPYLGAFTLLTLLGAACIFIVQALCSFAVIGYFQKNHRESRHWFKTFLAPLIGGLCMILMLVLLVVNVDALVGEAGNTVFFKMIPWIVLGVFLLGIGGAFYLRIKRPEKYAILGRMVMTETKEREEEQSA